METDYFFSWSAIKHSQNKRAMRDQNSVFNSIYFFPFLWKYSFKQDFTSITIHKERHQDILDYQANWSVMSVILQNIIFVLERYLEAQKGHKLHTAPTSIMIHSKSLATSGIIFFML